MQIIPQMFDHILAEHRFVCSQRKQTFLFLIGIFCRYFSDCHGRKRRSINFLLRYFAREKCQQSGGKQIIDRIDEPIVFCVHLQNFQVHAKRIHIKIRKLFLIYRYQILIIGQVLFTQCRLRGGKEGVQFI